MNASALPFTPGTVLSLIAIGLAAGMASGLFGVGGGILVVPALVYVLHFAPQKAAGTSLAILLPPVGLAAVLEYHRHGNVDLRSAMLVAASLFAGAWLGASFANDIDHIRMKILFGGFVIFVGIYTIVEALIEASAARR